jgi:hypothetical protein
MSSFFSIDETNSDCFSNLRSLTKFFKNVSFFVIISVSNHYDVAEQLKQIYNKLEDIITKNDTFLKNLVKDLKLEKQSELVSSIEKKLDIIETQRSGYVKM